MRIRVLSFNNHATAMGVSIIITAVALIYFVSVSLYSAYSLMSLNGGEEQSMLPVFSIALFMPFLYGCTAYIAVFFSLWVYSKLASKMGYIEFEAEQSDL